MDDREEVPVMPVGPLGPLGRLRMRFERLRAWLGPPRSYVLTRWLILRLLYGSSERIGQRWWSFGWEIQILEPTVIAACLVPPWDPRPLRAPAPPALAIVLMRWLAFRIMLGAGLIKLRGDPCWTELTC